MKQLVIAVDCDEVLIHSIEYMLDTYNRLYGTDVQLPDAHTPHFAGWKADRDEVSRRFDAIQRTLEYQKIAPLKETINVIHMLAKHHKLHVVTARPESATSVTGRMIDTYFADCFESIRHIGRGGDKGNECAALSASVLIDDSIKHLERARECGVPYRILFGKYAWQPPEFSQDIVSARCSRWLEVEEAINRYAAEQ